MKDLLKKYVESVHGVKGAYIDNYTIDGGICLARYTHHDSSGNEHVIHENINIWNMLEFIYNNDILCGN